MELYLKTIFGAMTLIAALNIAAGTASWNYIIIAVVFCTLFEIVLDGVIAFVVNKIPDKHFRMDRHFFHVTDKERELYRKLEVTKWESKIIELGWIGGFSKKEIKEPRNPKYIEKFIIECNRGVLIHTLSYFAGFLVMPTLFGICSYTIALPVALVNVALNILPIMILRNNTPKLVILLEHLKKREGTDKSIYL